MAAWYILTAMIAKAFDTLKLEEIYATILYYLHNKEAVSKYLAEWLDYCRRSREENRRKDPELYEKMRRLKAEWQARQHQQVEAHRAEVRRDGGREHLLGSALGQHLQEKRMEKTAQDETRRQHTQVEHRPARNIGHQRRRSTA